ncbi:MAG: carbamoyltransferase HypF [Limisphaerales bacterium]
MNACPCKVAGKREKAVLKTKDRVAPAPGQLSTASPSEAAARLKLMVRGAVQGVGFRPFVYRLANEMKLTGWVGNSSQGLFVEVEGPKPQLEKFLLQFETNKPPRSVIQGLEAAWLDPVGHDKFEIRPSDDTGEKSTLVLPDIATCPDCLREIFDPNNRRYLYPFTNCTHCGPRFSILEALPYDRANTSMKKFPMCPACAAEYANPNDRRFHAQPNACPACGPRLELWNSQGDRILGGHQALLGAAQAIRQGKIVAIKGLGGFHLFVDARNGAAVQLLRERKQREEKPFALLFSSLAGAKAICEISPLEERLLRSPEAPIVLLGRRPAVSTSQPQIAANVAPGNPALGLMLPSNPLHHLLMMQLEFPVIATSGNLNDEPICTDEFEALERLAALADLFLVHDRPIVRHVDDSIVRVVAGREMVLRRARGFAPLPVQLPNVDSHAAPVLAVGAHLKNSIALSVGNQVFLSQHIGDLETEPAHNAFRRVVADFETLYGQIPQIVVADLHPDYLSTQFADALKPPQRLGVQHHVAHVLSCMAENEVAVPALGIAWDGTGYGTDGTIWGGEFFLVGRNSCERVAHLRRFRLPGGDIAARQPRRAALGLLHEIFGDAAFDLKHLPPFQEASAIELSAIRGMLQRLLNSPLTSSVGRLFDAVASLLGLRQVMRFEGQAAMDLEFALAGIETNESYDFPANECRFLNMENSGQLSGPQSEMILDWHPAIEGILADLKSGVPVGIISAKFHNALAEGIVAVARSFGINRIVISGGCFQNRYLTERTVRRLREENFRPYWPQRIPPNDGGIALGQVVAALRAQSSPKNK